MKKFSLPITGKLAEFKNFIFDIREEEKDGKKIAVINIKSASSKPSFDLDCTAPLASILSSHKELPQLDEIKILGDGHDYTCVANPVYVYLYDFLKLNPDFQIKVNIGIKNTNRIGLSTDQGYLKRKIDFFIEQRRIWSQLQKLPVSLPAGASLNILFQSYCLESRILDELEFKNRNQSLKSFFFFSAYWEKKAVFNFPFPQFDLCLFRLIPDTGSQNLILFAKGKATFIYDPKEDKAIEAPYILGKSLEKVLADTSSSKTYMTSFKSNCTHPLDEAITIAREQQRQEEISTLQTKNKTVDKELKDLQSQLKFWVAIDSVVKDLLKDSTKLAQLLPGVEKTLAEQIYTTRQQPLISSLQEEIQQKEKEDKEITTRLTGLFAQNSSRSSSSSSSSPSSTSGSTASTTTTLS